MAQLVSLAEMTCGQTGIVTGITGGMGMAQKLHVFGICAGNVVTKVSGQWMHGPCVIRHDNTEVAIGFGMAQRIMVDIAAEQQ
jgi:ferrous iron transport protein A